MIRRALRFLVDLVVFALWDAVRNLRPVGVKCAMTFETWPPLDFFACPYCREAMRARLYQNSLLRASPRAMRYLEKRKPGIIFLWRTGGPSHPVTEPA